MRNVWIKKEAGFIAFKNRENSSQFVLEKFNNKDDMLEIEEKFRLLNLDVERVIGIFNNGTEIKEAMEVYKLKNGVNKEFFNEPEKHGPDREIPCPYPRLKPVTEGMFLYKWTKFKEDGGVLYTKYEAWEENLRDYWGYNETMLPEGVSRLKNLILQDEIANDADKLFFYSMVSAPAKIGGEINEYCRETI